MISVRGSHCRQLLGMVLVWAGCIEAAWADEQPSLVDARRLFSLRVFDLLQARCSGCHGENPEEREGGLDLRSAQGLTAGGDRDMPLVVPGAPLESPLYLAVAREHEAWPAMPPKESERLTAEEQQWIHDWIAGGAPWLEDSERLAIVADEATHRASAGAEQIRITTQGALSEAWAERTYARDAVWAYQPLKDVAVPVTSADHPIDAFLDLRRPAGLPVAPRADRATLIRRASFDLLGLPPEPAELDAFLNDPAPDEQAFSRLVDRLLASPHYGERQAQHWLDVTRYADSSGLANDYERGNAWRYRDYVVRAFNLDKPYDLFVREQLAGDELRPDDREAIIATGFLRMGPWELTGMEVPKVARQRFLDDVTNSVGETFLAHSLQCARCHDHKFDPIPTHDYYAIQAVFATTQLADRTVPFLDSENISGFEERRYLEQQRDAFIQTLVELDERSLQAALQWYRDQQLDPEVWSKTVRQLRAEQGVRAGGTFDRARTRLMAGGSPESSLPPRFLGFRVEDFGRERVARKGLERLAWELERYEPTALAVYNGATPNVKAVYAPQRVPADPLANGELEQTAILSGGDPFSPSTPVAPGILAALGLTADPPLPTTVTGRRLALASWIARPDNPLTTRTIVNRIWMWHFGQALAGNPNNFGSTGKRPTHPELLDWLALELVRNEWSLKQLHRLIMTSSAYQLSTAHPDPERLQVEDPDGSSYAVFRPRRLSASELRDAMLCATNELNRQWGGIPNRPDINLEAALQPRQVMGTFAAAWTPNPLPRQRHRRSIYALRIRGLPDPFLQVFNEPSADFSCEQRLSTTVTPQVFALFNSQVSYDRALALADDARREKLDDSSTIDHLFLRLFSRQPSSVERSACLNHWQQMRELESRRTPVDFKPPLSVVREAVEENTGEHFQFDEVLYSNADYQPDLQPSAVDLETRALANVCLALLNSSEFAYVY
jgi:hypothetical protein